MNRLLKISIPLMLTWLSTTIMMFADRLMLSYYSLEALGAAVNAGTIAWGFAYGFQIITEMAQVVVAQYSGAKRDDKASFPVWQMFYLVIFSVLFFLPMALFGYQLFFTPGSLQAAYFSDILLFGPVFGLIGASSAYFIGRGETRIVTLFAVLGNIVNLALDYFMIFGIEGVLEPMGIHGAALATGIGMSVQGIGLTLLFLSRTKFTAIPLKLKELRPCLRAGLPTGLFIGVELIGWGVFYSLMAKTSSHHLLVTSICQSLLPLFACVSIGLQKGIASLSGHEIGANNLPGISNLLKSALLVLGVYIALLLGAASFFPDPVISLFLNYRAPLVDPAVYEALKTGLILSAIYLFFGGVRAIVSGVLSAAGDTWFLMLAGGISVWLLLLLPVYLFVLVMGASVTIAQILLASYGLLVGLIYVTRYKQRGWTKNARLIEDTRA